MIWIPFVLDIIYGIGLVSYKMSNKKSLFDDPLGDPLSLSSNHNEIKKSIVFDDSSTNNDDIGLFKTLDSSKINLKKDKNQKTNAIIQQSKAVNAAEKGLGFTTSLWDNDVSKSKVDDLLNDISLKTTTSSSSNDTLFGSKTESNVKDDALAELGIKISPNIQNNTRGGKVNIGELDDNKYDDLKVGKLIEKEDVLDYDLFGKKNIVQARSVGTILHKQKNVSQTEDLEIESAEVLDNLERVALDNVFTAATTSILPQALHATANSKINTDDLDMTKFDINQYINDNKSGGGGLFD